MVTAIAPSCGFASEFALALFLATADLADGDVLLILPLIVVEPPPFPCVFLADTSGTAARAEGWCSASLIGRGHCGVRGRSDRPWSSC